VLRAAIASALVCLSIPALAADVAKKSVEVKLKVHSSSETGVGVPALIFRKKLGAVEEDLGSTDENGDITVYDTDCLPTTGYRAHSTQPMVFPNGKPRWKPCLSGQTIEIAIKATGFSTATLDFLKDGAPSDWVVPANYKGAIAELLAAQAKGEWGVSAKLGSQLADQFRAAGYDNQAAVFSELSLGATGIYAVEQSENSDVGTVILKAWKNGNSSVLTDHSKLAVAELQTDCGVPSDGVAGWKTMGCLPGGRGYKLPLEIIGKFDSGSTGGGF
jgi:hypothetical protein